MSEHNFTQIQKIVWSRLNCVFLYIGLGLVELRGTIGLLKCALLSDVLALKLMAVICSKQVGVSCFCVLLCHVLIPFPLVSSQCPLCVLVSVFPFLVACLSPSVCQYCFPSISSSLLPLCNLTCCSTSPVPRLVINVCVYSLCLPSCVCPGVVSSCASSRVSSLLFGTSGFWFKLYFWLYFA